MFVAPDQAIQQRVQHVLNTYKGLVAAGKEKSAADSLGLRPNLTPMALARARPFDVFSRILRRCHLAAHPTRKSTRSDISDVVSIKGSSSRRSPAPADPHPARGERMKPRDRAVADIVAVGDLTPCLPT